MPSARSGWVKIALAIGGHIQISAVFGDDHYTLHGTVTKPT